MTVTAPTADDTLAVIEFLHQRTFDLQQEIAAAGVDYTLAGEAHWLILARNGVQAARNGNLPEEWIGLHYADAVKRAAVWSDHPDYDQRWGIVTSPITPEMETEFDDFIAEVCTDPVAKAAFDDHGHRETTIDSLLAVRKNLGISAREVSRRMGVSDATVRRLEAEGSDPTVSLVQLYARAVGYRLQLDLKASKQ